ncbi:MAG TPA: hypothetical protein VI874_02415 [Candidatus Norongarragalinales archaeon]|nr:hypothetical protein [Candidatus Norongarragalinales archaeon]
MSKTFIVLSNRLENNAVVGVEKDIRNELTRAAKEGIVFREITSVEHHEHLREYRRRKNLLMPPFHSDAPRTFWAVFSKSGSYLCSLGLFLHNQCFRIQAVSIDKNAPYFAFSWLLYNCLQQSAKNGFRGLDLAGLGSWKEKWAPALEEDGFKQSPSRFGGKITPILARIYWFTEQKVDPISRRVHRLLVRRFG